MIHAIMDAWIEINHEAIAYNYQVIKQHVASDVCIAPVIKADAYGHGAVAVAKTLSDLGVSFFNVYSVHEAVQLRHAGLKGSILILGKCDPADIEIVIKESLTATIHSLECAQTLSKKAQRCNQHIPCHIKIDSGMGRLGILDQDTGEILPLIMALPGLQFDGIYTHFARADEIPDSLCDQQGQCFERALHQHLPWQGRYIHACNSAALFQSPRYHYNMVRPGLALYGYLPSEHITATPPLIPSMEVKSRIKMIRMLPKGATISYGGIFQTQRTTQIAIIPIGYHLGLSRQLSDQHDVLLCEKRAPIRGRICMDQMIVDITDIPEAKIGDEVVILGSQGPESITATDMASKINTIPYEILCRFGQSLERKILRPQAPTTNQSDNLTSYLNGLKTHVTLRTEDPREKHSIMRDVFL